MALTGNLTGSLSASMSAEGGVNGLINFDGSGTDNYNELDNKPSINGVVLEGNKTSADLYIESGGTDNYNELLNKPKLNGTTLAGDVSDTQLLIDYNHLINKPVIPDISEIETRLDTAETDIDDINDDIATIKATDLSQNADINSLKNRVTGTETNISNLTSRVSSAESSITTQGTQISSIEDDISDINSDVTGLDTRVGTAESDIDTLQGDMTQAQSDISELNSSLMKCQQVQFNIPSITIPAGTGQYSNVLTRFDLKTSTLVDTVFTNKQLKDIFGGHSIIGCNIIYAQGPTLPKECIVWANDQTISASVMNISSSASTVTTIRLLVFYI